MLNKTVILIPNSTHLGGVSNYYQVAKKYFSNKVKYIHFNSKYKKGLLKYFFNVLVVLKAFILIIIYYPKQVVINPSLGKSAFLRDSIFILWSHLFFKKTIVFWRGWNPENEDIFENKLFKTIFNITYKYSSKHFVLNKYIKTKLIEFGIRKEDIYLTNTIVDDSFIINKNNSKKNKKFTILFLTRVEIYKGIYETLEIYKKLKSEGLDFELQIAGTGSELNKIKEIVTNEKFTNIKFLGFVEGENKIKVFKNADIYLFPSYSEGMPNSVAEAMGSGLPVICSSVGALTDFFEDGNMGFIHKLPINIDEFVSSIKKVYSEIELQSKISIYNVDYASRKFIASNSIEKIEKLINND